MRELGVVGQQEGRRGWEREREWRGESGSPERAGRDGRKKRGRVSPFA